MRWWASLSEFWKKEGRDIRDILLCILLIPITWVVFFQWSPELSLMGHDGISQIWPFLSGLVDQSGDWHQVIYRAQFFGGTKIHDVFGTLPIFQFFAFLGFSTLDCMNFGVLFIQFCFAFIGIKAVTSFASDDKLIWPLDFAMKTALVWLLGFSPLLAWRLGMGHLNLTLGLLAILTEIAVFLWCCKKEMTSAFTLIALLALINSISSFGQQIIVYGAVFSFPLLLAIFISSLKKKSNGFSEVRQWHAFGLGFFFCCQLMPDDADVCRYDQ